MAPRGSRESGNSWPLQADDGDALRVTRHFLALPGREVHYRRAGQGSIPLVMFHAQPGSSKQMEGLMKALAPTRPVIGLDTPGSGDSATLPDQPEPTIQDYAVAALEALDALDLATVDVYGSHTGANIAAELAILAPNRVRKVVQDGVAAFDPAIRALYLKNYALPFAPDLDGSYLIRAFIFVRDMYTFFPWFERTQAARLNAGLPTAEALHAQLIEVVKNPTTYQLAYRASFSYDPAERLPLVGQPVLAVSALNDPLSAVTKALVEGLPNHNGRFAALPPWGAADFSAQLAAAICGFLDV